MYVYIGQSIYLQLRINNISTLHTHTHIHKYMPMHAFATLATTVVLPNKETDFYLKYIHILVEATI